MKELQIDQQQNMLRSCKYISKKICEEVANISAKKYVKELQIYQQQKAKTITERCARSALDAWYSQ